MAEDPFPADYFDEPPYSPPPPPPTRPIPLIVRQIFFSLIVGLGIGIGVLFFDGKGSNVLILLPFSQTIHRSDRR